jgi:hypothetical protein
MIVLIQVIKSKLSTSWTDMVENPGGWGYLRLLPKSGRRGGGGGQCFLYKITRGYFILGAIIFLLRSSFKNLLHSTPHPLRPPVWIYVGKYYQKTIEGNKTSLFQLLSNMKPQCNFVSSMNELH